MITIETVVSIYFIDFVFLTLTLAKIVIDYIIVGKNTIVTIITSKNGLNFTFELLVFILGTLMLNFIYHSLDCFRVS